MEIKINNVRTNYENLELKALDIDYTVCCGLVELNGVMKDVSCEDIGSMSIFDIEDFVRQIVTESIKNEVKLMEDK